ncbi:uncharacterized protein [Drosophila takahashii]|uniref:uncharacterized protein n=1 Tax=Drosophila takahashii TaxID=29030 RepID=UPI001CF916A6|nr:uncharacterized protein LOC108069508 [Drosophila takahashii]XP_044251309.1 uncharacterized protein LOC108069508 [Drosophila takahashii]XP_044251310.1 uncharacterized protein LOC108069508 [Drosophila takahashii]XP_044251311.1 uncharacterized protein LOC108069508 [Drosophila takahashii]
MATREGIQSYFSQLNSLSEKIMRDVNEVKSSYSRDAWLALSLNQQEKILNNHLINAEIYKYYNMTESNCLAREAQLKTDILNNDYHQFAYRDEVYSYNGQDLHTYIYQNVGLKILHDENTRECRDEHSYPFSYRTKSQINIPLKECDDVSAVRSPMDVSKPLYLKLRTKVLNNIKSPNHQIIVNTKTDVSQSKKEICKQKNDQKSHCVYKNEECFDSDEKLQLLYTFGSKSSMSNDFSDYENEFKDLRQDENAKLLETELQIPKGFDFLSNW